MTPIWQSCPPPRRAHLYALPDLPSPLRRGPGILVALMQAASQQALDAMVELDRAIATIRRELPRDTTLVCTPDGIVIAPVAPTCVALTGRRRRCANHVFEDGPGWSPATLAVLDPLAQGFPEQLCSLHRQDPPAKSVPVEWVIVDDEPQRWAHLLDFE